MAVEQPLFIYGTLLSAYDAGGFLTGIPRVEAKTRGELFDLPSGYPALRPIGTEWVYGELTQRPIDLRLLGILDVYEGVPEGLFRRVVVDAHVGLRSFAAWAFVMDDPAARGGRPLPNGRWRPVRRR